jgi:DNA polymerase I-like protein with 3'-5' exonuclease and polymerase domains
LPSWKDVKRVGLDTETKDPDIKKFGPGALRDNSWVVGISFAFEDGKSYYLPIRHKGGGNLDEVQVLNYLREQAEHFTGEIVGANLSYDLLFLAVEDIWFKWATFRDIQIADPLIYELHDSYSLNNIAKRYGFEGKDEQLLREAASAFGVDPKADMWKLHSRYVGAYAEEDAALPLKILRKQEEIILKEDLTRIWDLESKVLPVLVKLKLRGVAVDEDRLEQVELWSMEQETKALEEVYARTGVRIAVGDVWKPDAIAPAIKSLGIDMSLTTTGKVSIDKDFLDSIDHPVAKVLGWARKTNKLRTTFANSVRVRLIHGRIHCSFNQLARDDGEGGVRGARYGRLSSEQPNLQQQPARDEFAAMWRGIYVPDGVGNLWAALDYSQQEPRQLIHYAELCQLPRASEAAQRYRDDPNTDNHQMMADLAGIARKPAKELFLGKCYGMGGAKLCHKLGLPTKHITTRAGKIVEVAGDEGQAIIDRFDSQLPFVNQLAKMCEASAQRKGYTQTVGGRKCHFPKDVNGNYDWTHKALNRLIQGSSADQTKTAMVAVDAAGYEIQLQVHDELDLTVSSKKEAEDIAEIMMNCLPLRVPSKVDVEVGASWGEAK